MSAQGDFFKGDGSRKSSKSDEDGAARAQPLAARMRPRRLSEVVGQAHILDPGQLLPRLVSSNRFGSLIFYGPPGSGKTSIAEAIACETESRFVRVNAVMSNVAELRQILAVARSRKDGDTILFIDEIHRFNKAQQDLLLPDVEAGSIRLIGATTHNPGFYVNAPLLSRSHLFRLEPHSPGTIADVMKITLQDVERGLGRGNFQASDEVLLALARLCDGDLRRGLNSLEVIASSLEEGATIDHAAVSVFARERQIRYDADEDEHYDTISAFIKSMRGGDPDAALYWLAKMLAGGEEPRFIARRLVIFASEDVGLADSSALPLAAATHHACDFVGLPECRINLAHCVSYLALAPKSNSAYLALEKAAEAIRSGPVQSVPAWLKDTGGQASKRLGQGQGYEYSHGFEENISGQDFMEEPQQFYEPRLSGEEAEMAKRLGRWQARKRHPKPR